VALAQKHSVTVITSKQDKQKDIEALGATAAVGPVEAVNFLISTFAGADAVYATVPPDFAARITWNSTELSPKTTSKPLNNHMLGVSFCSAVSGRLGQGYRTYHRELPYGKNFRRDKPCEPHNLAPHMLLHQFPSTCKSDQESWHYGQQLYW